MRTLLIFMPSYGHLYHFAITLIQLRIFCEVSPCMFNAQGSISRSSDCSVHMPQIVQFVRVATETGGPEARASIVDACDTLLNLLIKVQLHLFLEIRLHPYLPN